jgi:prolyl-tRNA synthetase
LREVTTFKEAHTAHATIEEAEAQVREAVSIYKQIFDELGIPYVITKRPPWDTFAGAVYSIAFDTLAPDGRTLQIGTVHNLGQNFAKVYDLTYETPEGDHKHVSQTCYGISERIVAATMMVHGDDGGLCLPPNVAPIQVVIVPIPYKETEAPVERVACEVRDELATANVRVHLDDRDLRPGSKYYYWERRGVPLRVEIGPNDIKEERVTLVSRDTGKRTTTPRKKLVEKVRQDLEGIAKNLREQAWGMFRDSIKDANTLEDAREIIGAHGGIVRLSWCGQESCGKEIEERIGGDILGEEFNGAPFPSGICPACSKQAKTSVLVAKTY